MQAEHWKRLRSIYESASELSEAERAAYLERACASDADLRADVDRMLVAQSRAERFLDVPALDPVSPEPTPARVGSYKIVRRIASGGMGDVYEAVQSKPERRVALKMMRFGLDSPGALRRFEYEAEVLARLRHPGIAAIHEAGVHQAADGSAATPYFALEYIEGSRDILQYAQAEELGLQDRIELFLEVCDAVHYGHLRGVIHRDLKPANLLIDEHGRAKVIDFGVARATDADVAAGNLMTRTGELVGTLHYMSPEQLSGDPAELDTRSDVYGLGIVLYQLLCGRMPYDFAGKGLPTVAWTIREEPPIDPRAARPSLPEDLAWVLLRTLAKEPNRRYASASELAIDLRRFQGHEPVLAGPPSALYRVRKFVRRNRVFVGAAGSVALALVIGIVLATAGLMSAAAAAERATTENVKFKSMNQTLTETITAVLPEREGHDVRIVDMLDHASERIGARLAEQPEVQASMRLALGQSYKGLGVFDKAERELEHAQRLWEQSAPQDQTEPLRTIADLAHVLVALGRSDESRELLAKHTGTSERELGAGHEVTLALRLVQVQLDFAAGEWSETERELRELSALSTAEHGTDHPATLAVLSLLQRVLVASFSLEEAERVARQLVEIHGRVDGDEAYPTVRRRIDLARIVGKLGKYEEAEELYAAGIARLVEIVGDEHLWVTEALTFRALLDMGRRHYARAAATLREVLPVLERTTGADSDATLRAKAALTQTQVALGEHREAELSLREVFESRKRVWGPEHVKTLEAEYELARWLLNGDRPEEAEPFLMHCVAGLERDFGAGDHRTLMAMHLLGDLHYLHQRWEQMRVTCDKVLRGYERLYGPESELTIRAGGQLVVPLTHLRRYREAIQVAEENMRASLKVLGAADPALLLSMRNLADLYLMSGDPVQAEERFIETLERAREHYSADDPETLECLAALAICTREAGRADEAEILFLELLDTWGDVPDRRRVPYARHRLHYARCLRDLGRYDEAARELELVFEVYRTTPRAPGGVLVVDVAGELVEVLELAGETAAAQTWRERTREQ